MLTRSSLFAEFVRVIGCIVRRQCADLMYPLPPASLTGRIMTIIAPPNGYLADNGIVFCAAHCDELHFVL